MGAGGGHGEFARRVHERQGYRQGYMHSLPFTTVWIRHLFWTRRSGAIHGLARNERAAAPLYRL